MKTLSTLVISSFALTIGIGVGAFAMSHHYKRYIYQRWADTEGAETREACEALRGFYRGKTNMDLMHVQGSLDFHAAELEAALDRVAHSERNTKNLQILAKAKELQATWHIPVGSYESTNGPGISNASAFR